MIRRVLQIVLVLSLYVLPAAGQTVGPSTGGAVALDQALRFLGHYKRVLVIGAHPDDEDTELITVLSRGQGAETAYLALTRGEGGQNLIGDELGEGLGLVRTGELLAARRLDGGRQFFTRAYDFGYSKTLVDTWDHWSQDTVLKDVIRVVRRFQPQIVVSVFSGTPNDGHGQHQAAGWAAHEAFRLAGDSSIFPELATEEGLEPWAPNKLYRGTFFDRAATTLTLDGGVLDPAVGQSFHQIAMRSRSLHRSQDMGVAQTIGPSEVRLRLVEDRTGTTENALFAGVDTSLASVPGLDARGRAAWQDIGRALRTTRDGEGLAALRARILAAWPRASSGVPLRMPAIEDQLFRLDAALSVTERLLCDAYTNVDRLVPGDSVQVIVSCWNAGALFRRVTVRLRVGPGQAEDSVGHFALAPGALAADTARVLLAETLVPSSPYFLWAPRVRGGGMYVWPAFARPHFGAPTSPPFAEALFEVLEGSSTRREVMKRSVDQAIGEIRSALRVVPRIAVRLSPLADLWSTSGAGRPFTVSLEHSGLHPSVGRVRLQLPKGWDPVPAQSFRFAADGERSVVRFAVRSPTALAEGAYTIRAVAEDDAGRQYGTGVVVVRYAHISEATRVEEAVAQVRAASFQIPDVRHVGYVRGAADHGPEVLAGLGVPVTVLGAADLEVGDLTEYDAIVIGPRAYETEPAVVAHNGRLLQYAESGGQVVVQYQQHAYFRGNFAPYRLEIAPRHDRVTDETAQVTALQPDHPFLRSPNPIGLKDWEGWVQERGLYYPRAWSSEWTPLLRMSDPGEEPLDGSLLVASVGQGGYVYTGLALFRQLPAAVPGAVRLLLNLLTPAAHAPVP